MYNLHTLWFQVCVRAIDIVMADDNGAMILSPHKRDPASHLPISSTLAWQHYPLIEL